MIILKTNLELKLTFEKLIRMMKEPVEWKGQFVVVGDYLILHGRVRSLFFNFENKKVVTNIIDIPVKDEAVIEIGEESKVQNILNLVLYAFGKWERIRGIKVEQNYAELNTLFNNVLREISVEPGYNNEHFRFYKKGIRLNYEDVIQLALDADEETEQEAEEIQESVGLWHKLIWKKQNLMFSKAETSYEERMKTRIGNNFYLIGYRCPKCRQYLHMVIFPEGQEFRIETTEGGVFLARAYTCNHCNVFYTPVPEKLLLEGEVYVMNFSKDVRAYEDYIALLGAKGDRVSNYNFNEYEAMRNCKKTKEHKESQESLEEIYKQLPRLSDEEITRIQAMVEEGFYPAGSTRRMEGTIQKEIRRRQVGINGSNVKSSKEGKHREWKPIRQQEKKLWNNKSKKSWFFFRKSSSEQIMEKKEDKSISSTIPKTDYAFGYEATEGEEYSYPQSAASRKEKVYPQSAASRKEEAYSQPAASRKEKVYPQPAASEMGNPYPKPITSGEENPYPQSVTSRKGESYPQSVTSRKGEPYPQPTASREEPQYVYSAASGKKSVPYRSTKSKSEIGGTYAPFRQTESRKNITTMAQTEELHSIIKTPKKKALSSSLKRKYKKKRKPEEQLNYISSLIRDAVCNDRQGVADLYNKLMDAELDTEVVAPYQEKLEEKLRSLDESAIAEICKDPSVMTVTEAMEAYQKIQDGNFLPELKDNALEMLRKRLISLKTDECELLVHKLKDSLEGRIKSNTNYHYYPAKKVMTNDTTSEEMEVIQYALDSYGTRRGIFEYPILVVDTAKNHSGKEGMILTPEHLFYKDFWNAFYIDIEDIRGIQTKTGLLNAGIFVQMKDGNQFKIPYAVERKELRAWGECLEEFIHYLQEKPDSRDVTYLAREKHETICCLRCGCVYKEGNVCPKCGYQMNR